MSKGNGTWLGGYLLQVFPTHSGFVAFYRYVAFFNPYIHTYNHMYIIYIHTHATILVLVTSNRVTSANLPLKNSFHTWNCKGSTHHELRQPRKSAVARCPTWCSWASSCNGWSLFLPKTVRNYCQIQQWNFQILRYERWIFWLSLKLRSFRKFCNFPQVFLDGPKNSLQEFLSFR